MIGIYAGRFQPFHLGHYDAIEYLRSKCDEVYVFICSRKGDNPLDDKNPFTYEERRSMMRYFEGKVHFRHVKDQENDEEWTRIIKKTLPKGRLVSFTNNPHTAKAFKDHGFEVLPIPVQQEGLNATLIRKRIIRNETWNHFVPWGTILTIDEIRRPK